MEGPSHPGRSVLVLHSYYKGYKWTDDENLGIHSILEPAVGAGNLFVEYLDSKRFFEDRYLSQYPEVFRRKFLDHRIDLVVATDDNAFEFLKQYRDELFPGAPVVFCGVNYFRDEQLRGHRRFTGVSEDADVGASLDVALALRPGTRRIYSVTDETETGLAVRARIARLGPAWRGIPIEPLDSLPMESLLDRLRSLPGGSLVFYTFFARDAAGKVFAFDESSRLVSAASRSPVFGAWDFNLGYGLVGGKLTSGFAQGEAAGRIALRILNGERVESIPVLRDLPGRYMFDFLQLERWGISPRSLPPGSVVVNLPESPYLRYRGAILAGASALVLLAGANAVLVLNVRRRKRAEEALRQHQDGLEETIRERSSQLRAVNEQLQRDIQERERTEQALRRTEENFRSIFENAAEGVYQSSRAGHFLNVNPALAQMAGDATPGDFLERVTDIRRDFYVVPGRRDDFEAALDAAGEVKGFEALVKRRDGSEIWVLENARAVRDEGGGVRFYEGLVQDITEQRRTQEKLERTRKKLRSLAAELTRVEERERRAIATQLHDQLGALLAMTKVKLSSLVREAEGTPLAAGLEEVRARVGEAVQETRALTWELSPPVLYQLGLPAALDWLAESVGERQGLDVTFSVEGEERELGEERRFLVFAAVRELLLNVVKHAGARTVSIGLEWLGDVVKVTVQDDGAGFEPAGPSGVPDAGSSFGLFSIQERFADLGGRVEILSAPGQGTTVELVLPCRPEAEEPA